MKSRVATWLCTATLACASAHAAGLTDTVVPPPTGVVGDWVGGHDMRRPAHELEKGQVLKLDVKVERGKPTTIEIEEEHRREKGVGGYLVYVDGIKRGFRTWEGCGAGPVHYFVEVPAVAKDRVEVRIENVGDEPVAVGKVWAFADFPEYFGAAKMDVPYRVAPTVDLTWTNQQEDIRRVQLVKDSLGERANVKAAWTAGVGYTKGTEKRVEERIDYILSVARGAGLPVQIYFDSWWGHTPTGKWRDQKYQQVVWDETAKKMGWSVPNRWANTPWLTVSDPELNAFKADRVRKAAAHLAKRYREFLAEGQENLVLAVGLDNEPVYWASGNAGLGDHLLWADFNPSAVEAARKDGVTLDPHDGLSFDERRWLGTNLLRYQELIGTSVVDGLGRDAIVVAGGEVKASGDLLANNVYTQGMISANYDEFPMCDAAWPQWETAAPAAVRVGGEWNSDSLRERDRVLHQVALGRNAAVNAECEDNAANHRGVVPGYALGQRFYAAYNYPPDQMGQLVEGLEDVTRPWPGHIYRRVLAEADLAGAAARGKDVAMGVLGNTPLVVARLTSGDRPGVLEFTVDAPAGGFDGLWAEVKGRAKDFGGRNPGVCVKVWAGADEMSMRVMRTYSDMPHIGSEDAVDLSAVARGAKRVFVRVELHGPGLSGGLLSWAAVSGVRFTVPWPAGVTVDLQESGETLRSAREHNLLVSWRRDAELAMEKSGALAAREAYERGAYTEAYRLANDAACEILPATYVARGTGKLGKWPVRVEGVKVATVVLRECAAPERVRFTVEGEASVVVSGLTPGAKYRLEATGGDYLLYRDERGDRVAAADGEIRVAAEPPARRE